MKFKSVSLFAAIVAGAIIFSGCASKELIRPKQTEIDAYLQAHPDLPQVDQSCIADGRFEIGMLAATVEFLLGPPKVKEPRKQPWAMQEWWTYPKGKTRLFIMEDAHVVGIDEFENKKKK